MHGTQTKPHSCVHATCLFWLDTELAAQDLRLLEDAVVNDGPDAELLAANFTEAVAMLSKRVAGNACQLTCCGLSAVVVLPYHC